ncbi:hypothetical protein [Rhodospirillum sp. A1_3_36]
MAQISTTPGLEIKIGEKGKSSNTEEGGRFCEDWPVTLCYNVSF